jgi:ribosomal protein L11 methylase PrmA
MPVARDDFDFVRSTGLIDALVSSGRLVAEEQVDVSVLGDVGAAYVLEHPKLPFISYPYEWPFGALKDAALLQLDIHLAALEHGVSLSDASAYNVQFLGARPIFIDSLSFRRYLDGEFWTAHRQFCDQFLNPLLLQSILGVPYNAWYRGSLEGIDAEALNDVLPWYSKMRWGVLTNVVMQAGLQRKSRADDGALRRAQAKKLPLVGYKELLGSMRRFVSKLAPRHGHDTDWQRYADDNSYQAEERKAKTRFVSEFVEKTNPRMLWDMGCNSGDYSVAALEAGASRAIGFDFDYKAANAAYGRAADNKLEFTPLVLDAANPSPGQGWSQAERAGLEERRSADALLALALVHHLAIGKNVPMADVLDWLIGLAPTGVIEFVQKTDPMVQELLRLREDIFEDYGQEAFEFCLGERARIVRAETVSAAGRRLYWYSRDGG